MGYHLYKTLHYLSLLGLVISLIQISIIISKPDASKKTKRILFAIHGLSWLLLFGSAEGLVRETGLSTDFPTWAKIKTALWFLLGIMPFFIKKLASRFYLNMVLILSISSVAIYLAVYKPFLQ